MVSYFKNLKLPDRIVLVIFVVGFFLGAYASLIEPFRLKVTRWDVSTEKWTNPAELKIAILTDMHMIWPWMTPAHLQKIVEETNKLHPDIIVLLGDYVGTHPFGLQIDPKSGLAPVKKLSSRCGVYAVIGNHDLHPPSGWPEALIGTGVSVLQNQAMSVDCNNNRFWVGGLEDLWYGHADIEKTLVQVTDKNPVIMLMHNPDLFVRIPQSVTLSLAGHTHGGQVRLPFIGAVAAVIPSEFGERYAYGHIVENDKDLVVSSGLGMTGLPIRFLNLPEISLITLKNTRSGGE